MRIAVLGTGNVGGALGSGWAHAGHQVIFGARDVKLAEASQLLARTGGKAKIMPVQEAVTQAEATALAVPWNAVAEVLGSVRPTLAGKILIDCTNPTTGWPELDHSAGSGGEQVARMVPEARVVKAFNTTGFENMQNPRYGDSALTMFYAGDELEAKKAVHALAKDLGFDPIDAGGLKQSHALENLASFWGSLAYGQKMGREIGFRLLRRKK